jgi:hypothetical protein
MLILSFLCRSDRVPTDACARRSVPSDAPHGTQGLQPLQQRHHQDTAKICCQILSDHRFGQLYQSGWKGALGFTKDCLVSNKNIN